MKVLTKNAFEHDKATEPAENGKSTEHNGKAKEEEPVGKVVCVITAEHFENALRTFTPSLPPSERQRYQQM